MRKATEGRFHGPVGLVPSWACVHLNHGTCHVRWVLVNHIVMLSTDDVTVTVVNDMIVMIDMVTWWRMVARISMNDVVMLSTDHMAVTVSDDVIVVIDMVARLMNPIVLPESVAAKKRCASDHG